MQFWDSGIKMVAHRCACCAKCWINPVTRRCIYGGPFAGYERLEESGGTETEASATRTLRITERNEPETSPSS